MRSESAKDIQREFNGIVEEDKPFWKGSSFIKKVFFLVFRITIKVFFSWFAFEIKQSCKILPGSSFVFIRNFQIFSHALFGLKFCCHMLWTHFVLLKNFTAFYLNLSTGVEMWGSAH